MTLYELLKSIDKDSFPIGYDPDCGGYFYKPDTCFKIQMNFGEEETVTCNIASPILLPWYMERVENIMPVDNHTIGVWCTSNAIRDIYQEYVKEAT